MHYQDDLGRSVSLAGPPQRIVSLVPSLTETLFALGGGGRIAGVTTYCTQPREAVDRLTKVGGTKDPRLQQILALRPDLLIANDEENRLEDIEWLVAQGIPVYVTAPRTVVDGIRLIERLGLLLGDLDRSRPLVTSLSELYDATTARAAQHPRLRVFCPIWRKPWMSFNSDTYIDNLVWSCGGHNVLRESPVRYCEASLEEVAAHDPQVVLLPSEPYPFTSKHLVHLKDLADTTAGRGGHFYCVDGMALCWYGPRIADGLRELARLLGYVHTVLDD